MVLCNTIQNRTVKYIKEVKNDMSRDIFNKRRRG